MRFDLCSLLFVISCILPGTYDHKNFGGEGRKIKLCQDKLLCPPQTRDLVVDNYLWSTTKSYRQLYIDDKGIPRTGAQILI